MTTAKTLNGYLKDHKARYEIIKHPRAIEAARIAQTAHVTGEKMAKGVLLSNKHDKLLAVIPATHKLDLEKLSNLIGKRLNIASEQDVTETFHDCDEGAVPACGPAYGLNVYMDHSLMERDDVYFEAGDHRSLIHMDRAEFVRLMPGAAQGAFSDHR